MTKADFAAQRRDAVSSPDGSNDARLRARNWIMSATYGQGDERKLYRMFPKGFVVAGQRVKYGIDKDIVDCLPAFHGDFDDLSIHNYRLLRRFLLERFAYGEAKRVDERLKGNIPSIWLKKDYCVPRLGLALILGFGGVLGVSPVWAGVEAIAQRPGTTGIATTVCLVVALLLIYLHVRERIGPVSDWRRSFDVFGRALIWLVMALVVWKGADAAIGWMFNWSKALVAGSAALVLAILGNFFFGQGQSMGKPL